MAYRGKETDPLEIALSQRRLIRRILIITVASAVLPGAWRLDPFGLAAFLPGSAGAVSASSGFFSRRIATAKDLEDRLREAGAHGAIQKPECSPGVSGWDYVCTYEASGSRDKSRLKLGLMVNGKDVVQTSAPQDLGRSLPPAPPRAPTSNLF